MYLTQKHLSRRTVLKGIGVTMALPFLEAMVPARGARRRPRRGKIRFAAIEMVHGSAGSTAFGIEKNMWAPAAVGREFDLSPSSLAPLEPFRERHHHRQQHRRAQRRGVHGAGNRRRSLPLERGVPDADAPEADAGLGRPRRHLARPVLRAAATARTRAIPSMQLCIENVDQAGGCSYGYSCVYTDSISWAAPDQPLPMVRDPRTVFDQLFGVGATPEERAERRGEDKSILDWIGTAVSRLNKNLGAADRARLADYLDDVREIERRIQQVEAPTASGEPRELPGAPVGVPDSFEEHVKLMFDLQALAFASDTTRVFAFKLGRDASNRVYPDSGYKAAFHSASHHQDRDDRDHRVREDQPVPRQHGSVFPREAEEHAGRRRQPARQHAGPLRLADGQLERAQPQALPAVPRRPRRRQLKGGLHLQGRRRHADGQRDADGGARCSAWTTVKKFGDSTARVRSEHRAGDDRSSVIDDSHGDQRHGEAF